MNNEPLEPGRRILLSRHWWWLPGMRYRLTPYHPWCRYAGFDNYDDDGNVLAEGIPSLRSQFVEVDLADPATRGCVLQLIYEAYEDVELFDLNTAPKDYKIVILLGKTRQVWKHTASTMEECLVAALEKRS